MSTGSYILSIIAVIVSSWTFFQIFEDRRKAKTRRLSDIERRIIRESNSPPTEIMLYNFVKDVDECFFEVLCRKFHGAKIKIPQLDFDAVARTGKGAELFDEIDNHSLNFESQRAINRYLLSEIAKLRSK